MLPPERRVARGSMLYEGGARLPGSTVFGVVEAEVRFPVDFARRTDSAGTVEGFGDGDLVRVLCADAGLCRAESAECRCAMEPPDEPEATLWFKKRETPSVGMEGSVEELSLEA